MNILLLFYFSFLYFGSLFGKTSIPLKIVGYEMITASSALGTLLAIYHLVSNACLWNNCLMLAPILFHFAGHWDQLTCGNLLHSPLGKNKRQKKSKEVSQNNLFFSISVSWICG